MNITDVKLFKSTSPKVKAYGHFVLDNLVQVNVTIFENDKGAYPVLPGYKGGDGKWKNSVWIKEESFRANITDRIMTAYHNMGQYDQTQAVPTTNAVDQTAPTQNVPF